MNWNRSGSYWRNLFHLLSSRTSEIVPKNLVQRQGRLWGWRRDQQCYRKFFDSILLRIPRTCLTSGTVDAGSTGTCKPKPKTSPDGMSERREIKHIFDSFGWVLEIKFSKVYCSERSRRSEIKLKHNYQLLEIEFRQQLSDRVIWDPRVAI